MNVFEAIRSKHAVRLFDEKPVPHDDILKILDAGRKAQSSKNTQPWQFVVIEDKATLKTLSQTGAFAGHIAGAAFAVALVGSVDSNWNSFDLGQAASYLQLAAWELGVGSCIAAISDMAAAKMLLGIPPEMNFYAALSFGYPSSDFTPAKMGGRKPIDEIVRWETWTKRD